MNVLIKVFNTLFYQPLLNILILLYLYLPGNDFGIAVIVLTLITRLILLPGSIKSIRSQITLTNLQPKIKAIKQKYKTDKEAFSRAMMEIYQREKINPFSGCLPLLFQLPILIALYQVFLKGLKPEVLRENLYYFVSNPGTINPLFLGFIDLSKTNVYLALITAGVQFFQMKISQLNKASKDADFSSFFQIQMLYIFPLLTFFIVWKLGAIISLYWITSTIFSIGEHYIVKLKIKKVGNYEEKKEKRYY